MWKEAVVAKSRYSISAFVCRDCGNPMKTARIATGILRWKGIQVR
jgi:hypothetical protein